MFYGCDRERCDWVSAIFMMLIVEILEKSVEDSGVVSIVDIALLKLFVRAVESC